MQNFTDPKPLCIRYDKIDGLIKIHNEIRCLVSFGKSWFDKICDRMNNEKTKTKNKQTKKTQHYYR